MKMQPTRVRKLVVLGAVVYAIALLAAIPVLWKESTTRRVAGWSSPSVPYTTVKAVDPAGPAAGLLQVGDRIVGIEDMTSFPRNYRPQLRVSSYPPGTSYTVRVLRNGLPREFRLQIAARPDRSRVVFLVWNLLASLSFVAIGILMGWKRPDLVAARWGWIGCQLTAFVYLSGTLRVPANLNWQNPTELFLLLQVGSWNEYAAWRFVDAFPFPIAAGRVWRAVQAILAILTASLSIYSVAETVSFLGGYGHIGDRLPLLGAVIGDIWGTLHLALAAAVVVSIVRNYRLHRDPAVRRRIELVAGSVVFGTGIVCAAVSSLAWNPWTARWMEFANLAPLPIPFVFYYAVLHHRVFDIRLAVRRGLQYLLAKNVLRFLTLLPVALLGVRIVRNPSAPIGSLLNVAGIGLLLSAGLGLEFRPRILAAVDRWFFRASLDRENLLRRLLLEIARLGSYEEIAASVERRLRDIFAPESIALSEDSSAPAPVDGLAFAVRAPNGAAVGCLLLGPKKSEEPYSNSERDLLEAVAAQIGLVRESLLAAEDRFQAVLDERNRIARELHDTLSQGFAGISLHLEAVRSAMDASPVQARESLDAARSIARDSMREARESLRDLRVSSSHLEVRLRALAERSPERPKVSVVLPEGVGALASSDAGWHLARVAEEAVTNVFKHAAATRVEIELRPEGELLILRVRDDGAGFDPAAAGSRGFGLLGMRERMGQLRGSVEIISSPGKGTEIRAAVPSLV
jgi:signal transduction histidine kinase